MPISIPSARADAMFAEQTAFQRLADTKSQEEGNEAFEEWPEASEALIAAHATGLDPKPIDLLGFQ